MIIRQADTDDLPAIAEIYHQLHEHHRQIRPDFFKDTPIDKLTESLEGFFYNYNMNVIVCENEAIDGYAIFELSERENDLVYYRKRCYIEHLAVKKDKQRLGIGKALSEYIRNAALEKGCSSIELDSWYENYDAMDFYVKCGYMPRTIKMEQIL